MDINKLISIVKKKIIDNIVIEKIDIEDKTFLHKKHSSYIEGKYHLKIKIKSIELKKNNKIEANKRIYKILDEEIKNNIHSIQILIT